MSDEAQVRSSLIIKKGNIDYSSKPTVFNADVSGALGPTPGALTIGVIMETIPLTEITTPGLCRLMNTDDTNYVTYGIYDGDADVFYPFGELGPGETYVIRLSRFLGRDWANEGSGTADIGGTPNLLAMRAEIDPCIVLVEAFEA